MSIWRIAGDREAGSGLACWGRAALVLRDPAGRASHFVSAELEAPLAGAARVGAWMPLRLHLSNGGPAFNGEARLVIHQVAYERPIELPTGSQRRLTFFVIPYRTDFTVQLSLSRPGRPALCGVAALGMAVGSSSTPAFLLLATPEESLQRLRALLFSGLRPTELDTSSPLLGDVRTYDSADLVVLSPVAVAALAPDARRALARYLFGGGAVLLAAHRDPGWPEQALVSLCGAHTAAFSVRETSFHRSKQFPALGWRRFGRGRLLCLLRATLEAAESRQPRYSLRNELVRLLRLRDGLRQGRAAPGPVDEGWAARFAAPRWPWRWRARWTLSAGAYVLLMAAFLLPLLRRRGSTLRLCVGALAASLCFGAGFLLLGLPRTGAWLQTTAIVTLRSGSTTAEIERWAELGAPRSGVAVLSAPAASGLRPVFGSWVQLSQSRFTVRESDGQVSYSAWLATGERRWFRLQQEWPLRQAVDASLRAAPRGYQLSITAPLPAELDQAVLLWRDRAAPIGRIPRDGHWHRLLPVPGLSLAGAMERAGGKLPADRLRLHLAGYWRRRLRDDAPYLLGWSRTPVSNPLVGRFSGATAYPVLYAIELQVR